MTQTQTVHFPFGTEQRPGYLARPDGNGPFPGVVVIHEIFGLNENIKEIADRFAAEGYVALAVDLFGERNRVLCMFNVLRSQLFSPLENGGIRELKSALTYLEAQPGVDEKRVGAIGFCMGGGFAIAWAASDNRLQAIAPYYGTNPRPLEAVKRLCPVVGSYPEKDFTAGAARKLDAELTKNNIEHDIKIYPNARHSFFNNKGPAYNAEAAQDSWSRVLTFFSVHLV